jgi:hypothetical protein
MKIKGSIINIIFLTGFSCSALFAQYHSTELMVIPWGNGTDSLKITFPAYEDVNYTPADSNDDFVGTAGPSQGFVDKNENCYFTSNHFMQLKGFGKDYHRIFDYSKGEPGYNAELFKSALRQIYVDSLSNIYVVDGIRYDYVSVVDTVGHILDKLSPYGPESEILVYNIRFNSDDILTICCKDNTFHTYENGTIQSGGGRGWRAKDGNYYNARIHDSTQIKFIKYHNPDLNGISTDIQDAYKSISGAVPYSSEFLGVDNDMNLYLYLIGPRPSDGRVLVYDTAYSLKEEIIFAQERNQYMWYMAPYMRPSDGNIYEFRCLDDGLHVIRWSRK